MRGFSSLNFGFWKFALERELIIDKTLLFLCVLNTAVVRRRDHFRREVGTVILTAISLRALRICIGGRGGRGSGIGIGILFHGGQEVKTSFDFELYVFVDGCDPVLYFGILAEE